MKIDHTLSLNYLIETINLNSLYFKLNTMSFLPNATSINKQQVTLDLYLCRSSQFQATGAQTKLTNLLPTTLSQSVLASMYKGTRDKLPPLS